MRIVFAGTPDFSVPALEALLTAGHEVVAVYTQPDRRAGRGRQTMPGPVKQCAEKHGLTIEQPLNLSEEEETLKSFHADVMVVVAYGLLLPDNILNTPRYGCLNIHASLLPRWRGAAPIHRAILAGDAETGITIMQMDSGLDTGDMLLKSPLKIKAADTGQSLHDHLSTLGAEAITEVLTKLPEYQSNAISQQGKVSSYAKKLVKQESNIDWSEDADAIERRIRAFTPWPGTQSWYKGIKLRIFKADVIQDSHQLEQRIKTEKEPAIESEIEPGTILAADKTGVIIACGSGHLLIHELQRPGGKPLAVADFLNGMQLDTGIKLQYAEHAE